MKTLALLGDTALRTSAALGLALAFASPALAQMQAPSPGTNQTTPTPDVNSPSGTTAAPTNEGAGAVISPDAAKSSDADDSDATIVVTGSRIVAPNLTSSIPITSVSGQQFYQTGKVSIGDVLNNLPSIRSTFSEQNSTRFLGTAGLNLVDLRGLGTQRTLVLINGRRQVGSDILNNAVSVDLNTISTNLIDRTDIVTGGDSAVYGSDAISGVINFILKDHYDGLEARAQGGASKYGDAGSYRASILAGKNFSEDRGNIAVSGEYSRQEAYYGANRPNLSSNNAFVTVDTDPAGSVNGSDGVPDRMFMRDIRSTTLANGGLVSFASPTGACGTDKNSGARFNCTYIFNPDGSLVPQTGTRVGVAPNGSFLGGNGSNFRGGQQLVLQPRQDRYLVDMIGHYEFSPAFVPFVEAKYAHITTTGSTSGPAFFQGSTLDANLERPRLDNPFLSPQARALITSQLLTVNPAAVITGATRFQLKENLLDLGVRNEASKRDTYRIVGGVRGDFGGVWHYEVSGNYGVFKESTRVEGNLNIQRFLLALDSGRNAGGQIVCRSQINAANGDDATAFSGDGLNLLASDIAGCVPLNPFGQGNISQAAKNYVLQDTTSHGKITQAVADASINGDSSKWFELPGGPVYFAAGAEYRRETNSFVADPLVENGYTFYNALPTFKPPSFAVKEAFAEIRVPLLKDRPLFRELTLTGAGRVADYKGATGTVYAYSGAVIYKPIADVTLRGNYSHSVRAPNLSELYATPGQNFAPNFVDPCSARDIATGSANRVANCAAAGIPASYDYVYVQSLQIVSGGNPNLKAETSNSYTGGVIYSPHYIPGLSMSADYYDITVNKVITAVDAQTIANNCYDLATNNSFCSLFQRNTTASGPKGEIMYQILEGSLLQSSLNFAKLKARGIDVDVSYHHRIGGFELAVDGKYTHVLQRDDFVDPTDPGYKDRDLGELGDPKDAVNVDVGVKRGPISVNYELRYLSHMYIDTYEDVNPLNGLPPQNADYADRTYYPAVFYHDARIAFDVTDRFNIYGGVDNITNRLPPLGLTGVGDGSGIYDVRGRFFYAGVVTKF